MPNMANKPTIRTIAVLVKIKANAAKRTEMVLIMIIFTNSFLYVRPINSISLFKGLTIVTPPYF